MDNFLNIRLSSIFMWVAKFKLKDDKDIYTSLCKKYDIEFYAYPYTNFIKNKKINLVVGGIISGLGNNKKRFINELRKDKRVKTIDRYHDFIIVHVQHPLSRESKAEIGIFYNPQYIIVKPVHASSDGWEYWEVACLDRKELNKLVKIAEENYHGKLFSIMEEKVKGITSLGLMPGLTDKQNEILRIAYKKGYYGYPRKVTINQIAKEVKKSYSTVQEILRRAESKMIEFFLKYRV